MPKAQWRVYAYFTPVRKFTPVCVWLAEPEMKGVVTVASTFATETPAPMNGSHGPRSYPTVPVPMSAHLNLPEIVVPGGPKPNGAACVSLSAPNGADSRAPRTIRLGSS